MLEFLITVGSIFGIISLWLLMILGTIGLIIGFFFGISIPIIKTSEAEFLKIYSLNVLLKFILVIGFISLIVTIGIYWGKDIIDFFGMIEDFINNLISQLSENIKI